MKVFLRTCIFLFFSAFLIVNQANGQCYTTANLTTSDVTCPGGTNGEITISIVGGSGDFLITFFDSDTGIPLDALFISGQEHTFSGISSGAYTVTVTQFGCIIQSFDGNVGVENDHPITSPISGNNQVCENVSGVLFSVIPTAGSTYNWTVPAGASIVSGQGTGSIFVNFGSTAGDVSVVETSVSGCKGDTVRLAMGFLPTPDPTFTASSPICLGQNSIVTISNVDSTANYIWDFDGGSIVSGSGGGPYEISWTSMGSKTINLTVEKDSCNASSQVIVNIDSTSISSEFSIFSRNIEIFETANVGQIVTIGYPQNWPDLIQENFQIPNPYESYVFTWDFDGAKVINSYFNGAVHEVKWESEGAKQISLIVEKDECLSELSHKNLQLTNAIPENCPDIIQTAYSVVIKDASCLNTYDGSIEITFLDSNGNVPNLNLDPDGGDLIYGLHGLSTSGGTFEEQYYFLANGNFNDGKVFIDYGITYSFVSPNVLILNNVPSSDIVDTRWGYRFSSKSKEDSINSCPLIHYNITAYNESISTTFKVNYINSTPVLSEIIGLSEVCPFQEGVSYQVEEIAGVTYNWVLPGDATITIQNESGSEIVVNFGNTAGDISVTATAENGCTSKEQVLHVNFVDESLISEPFTMSNLATLGEVVNVSLVDGAVNGKSYTWDFGGAVLISANEGVSYQLRWLSEGRKEVKLLLETDSCGIIEYRKDIEITASECIASIEVSTKDVTCIGGSDGSYKISVVGGSGIYRYELYEIDEGENQILADSVVVTAQEYEFTGLPSKPYRVVILQHIGGCPPITSSIELVGTKETPPTSPISGPSQICVNEAGLSYSVDPTEGSTYDWTVPTGTSIVSGQGTANIVVDFASTTGEITVIETSEAGCTGDIVRLEVNKVPTFTFDLPSEAYKNELVTISFTETTNSGASFTWDFGDGEVVGGNEGETIQVRWLTEGIKVVKMIVDSPDCGVFEVSKEIEIKFSHCVIDNTISIKDVTCLGQSDGSLKVSFIGGEGDYYLILLESKPEGLIQVGEAEFLSNHEFEFIGLPAATYSLWVFRIGCNIYIADAVIGTSNDNPITSPITGNNLICENATGIAYSVVPTEGSTYEWAVPTGASIVSGQGTANIVVDFASTTGEITVVETSEAGCTGEAVSLSISTLQNFTFDLPAEANKHELINIFYNGSNIPEATFTWDFGDAEVVSVNEGESYQLRWFTEGIKVVNLVLEIEGCGSIEISKEIDVKAASCFTGYDFYSSNVYCESSDNGTINIQLFGAEYGQFRYLLYDAKSGDLLDESPTIFSPSFSFGKESNSLHRFPIGVGSYQVAVWVFDREENCEVLIEEVEVAVKENDFDASRISFTDLRILCAMRFRPSIQLLADEVAVLDVISYQWDFGDGNTSTEKAPFHEYSSAGDYEVTLSIVYAYEGCEALEASVTRTVTYSTNEGIPEYEEHTIEVQTLRLEEILVGSASTFSDSWPLGAHLASLEHMHEMENASKGVWRNEGLFVYDVPRSQSETLQLDKDGSFTMDLLDWNTAAHNVVPNWIKTTEMTRYNAFGHELENKDVLGIYSAAIYDYGGHLASATGANMRHAEMAFTGFEYMEDRSGGNWTFGSGDGAVFQTFEVFLGFGHLVRVKAPIRDLEHLQKVDLQAKFGIFTLTSFELQTAYYPDNTILCMQADVLDPENITLMTLKYAPDAMWSGSIQTRRTRQPIQSADIDHTFAHTGKSSLRIGGSGSQSVFRQEQISLEVNKPYHISVWASDKDIHSLSPKPKEGLGVRVILKNKYGETQASYFFAPSGNKIEGWQQIKGTFVVPGEGLVMELSFEKGSAAMAWFDDLRLHPERGNMKSYVYDIEDYRLKAVLDEENFATYYAYDKEGNLYSVRKETETGIVTLTENVVHQVNPTYIKSLPPPK